MTRAHRSKMRAPRIRRLRRITSGLVNHYARAISPDGHRLVNSLGEGRESFWVVSDRKGRVGRVLEGPAEGGATVAADGTVIYGRQVGATTELWRLPSAGGSPKRLFGGDGRLYRDPALSPDGRFLCYAADDGSGPRHGALRLWLFDFHQATHELLCGAEHLVELLDDTALPDSPDRIVMVEGSERPQLGGEPVRLSAASWSPAGDAIFFELHSGESTSICGIDLATRRPFRLTGAGYRRPSALGKGRFVCERQRASGTEVVLLVARPTRKHAFDHGFKLTEFALTERDAAAREPVAIERSRGKGSVIAWSMPCPTANGEPSRYELHVADLDAPTLKTSRRAADDKAEASETTEASAEKPAARDGHGAEEA